MLKNKTNPNYEVSQCITVTFYFQRNLINFILAQQITFRENYKDIIFQIKVLHQQENLGQ